MAEDNQYREEDIAGEEEEELDETVWSFVVLAYRTTALLTCESRATSHLEMPFSLPLKSVTRCSKSVRPQTPRNPAMSRQLPPR